MKLENIEAIQRISEYITDESMIQFKDGKTIKGATEVTTLIMQCCEEHNKGYLEGLNLSLNRKFIGAMLIGGAIGISSVLITQSYLKRKSQTINQKQENNSQE